MINDYRVFRQEEASRLKAGKEAIYKENMKVGILPKQHNKPVKGINDKGKANKADSVTSWHIQR